MFTGICILRDQEKPKLSFPCLFIDYGSSIPRVKRSPISTRTHAINLLVESVKTPWILFFKPGVSFIEKNFPKLADEVDLIFSKGYYGNRDIDYNILNFAIFVKKKKFPVLDNELSESDAFLKLFKTLKRLKSKEVTPSYWSVPKEL